MSASNRPSVGDTKTSMVRADHIGWLLCDGRALPRTEYKALYAVLGTDFSATDDGETFNLPDARGRVAGFINVDNENTPANGDLTEWTDGDVSGEETHVLTIAELPAHNHDISGGYLNVSGGIDPSGNGNTSEVTTGITVNSAGDHQHYYDRSTASNNGINIGGSAFVATGTSPALTDSSGAHIHTIMDPGHRHQIASVGGSQAHNNIQPTIFLGNLFIFSGRVTHNASYPPEPANRNYFPPTQSVRLY